MGLHFGQDLAQHQILAVEAPREAPLGLPDLLPQTLPQLVESEGRVIPLVEEALRHLVEPLVNRLRRGIGRLVYGLFGHARASKPAQSSIVENPGEPGGYIIHAGARALRLNLAARQSPA
jgi:hypothetical protein